MVLSFLSLPTFSTCGKKVFKSDELHVTRRHKRSVLILMTSGILRFREDGKDVELHRGEYYIQRKGLFQTSSRPSGDAYYIYLDFNGVWCDDGIFGLPVRGSFDIEKIYRNADLLCRANQSRNLPLVSTSRVFYEILEQLFSDNRSVDDRLMTAVKIHDYISENCTNPIDVSSLAERFSYTPDYVIRVFKRAYGVTPYSYLTSCRVEYAKLLLLNTDRPVGEISEACGYGEFTTFFRAFRAHTGMSPKSWRSAKRSKGAEI